MIKATTYTTVVLRPEGGKGESIHGGFCHGCYLLLKGISETGALFASARDMGMAYSKAWKMLKECESDFGVRLVDRHGPHGSKLTDDGRELIRLYERVVENVHAAANEQL